MIKVDFANVVTIGLAGVLGYGVLVAAVKVWQLVQGQAGGSSST